MEKYKIGYTTGVFDLFHVGHLNILRRAKEQCEYLIVGVSTDELVKEYKNKVPVIPYQERRAIIEAIKYVDKVIPQKDRNKLAALSEIKFDVMFVGDDWKNTSFFDEIERMLKLKEVDLIYLPHTDGISSSILRKKINK